MCEWGTDTMIHVIRRNNPYVPDGWHPIAVDACIADYVQTMNDQGVITVGCCCGHGKETAVVLVARESVPLLEQYGYAYRPLEGPADVVEHVVRTEPQKGLTMPDNTGFAVRRHLVYLRSLLRHKWFVFLACLDFGVPIWSAILHDWDKFMPDEWFAYARYFYDPVGKKIDRRDKTGYYDAANSGSDAFDRAWLLHQKRNKHHWQYWVLPYDDGRLKLLPMPDRARREMLADWFGAGRAYDECWTPINPLRWYEANKDKMQLHPETQAWVEAELARRERDYKRRMAIGTP